VFSREISIIFWLVVDFQRKLDIYQGKNSIKIIRKKEKKRRKVKKWKRAKKENREEE